MAMLKKMVLTSIEETNGASPKDVLTLAKGAPLAKDTRVFARDYMPAMRTLMKKGYSARESARLLVGMGCPFAEGTLTQYFWQRA